MCRTDSHILHYNGEYVTHIDIFYNTAENVSHIFFYTTLQWRIYLIHWHILCYQGEYINHCATATDDNFPPPQPAPQPPRSPNAQNLPAPAPSASPFPPFYHIIIIFFLLFVSDWQKFCIFAIVFYKKCKDILLNRLSIATREETSKTFNIGTAPSGRRLPIFESGLWRAESRMANVCAPSVC